MAVEQSEVVCRRELVGRNLSVKEVCPPLSKMRNEKQRKKRNKEVSVQPVLKDGQSRSEELKNSCEGRNVRS